MDRILRLIAPAVAFGILAAACQAGKSSDWQSAIEAAAQVAPGARIVVLDIGTGHTLAAHRLNEAAHTLAAPGSTLKPLVLYALVAEGRWNPERRVACNRRLTVAGHRLACTHPPAAPFNAEEALAWSCNSYFAAVAQTLAPGELGGLLRPTGLLAATGLARDDAMAEFHEPLNTEEQELALLGVSRIRVTPLELASAYRWMALQLASHPDNEAARVVRVGLADSARFGMAGEAGQGGAPVAGKTGTAEGAETNRTHGWFAGLFPADRPQVVILVYLPAGRGADAAHVAGVLLQHAPMEGR